VSPLHAKQISRKIGNRSLDSIPVLKLDVQCVIALALGLHLKPRDSLYNLYKCILQKYLRLKLKSPCGENPAFNVVYVCMWCF